MVEDWINKTSLAKIGYHFDPATLTDFEVCCFNIISNKMRSLELKALKDEKD